MEFGFFRLWQDGWVGAIIQGAALTVLVGFLSMIGGLAIGTVCGVLKWRRVFLLSILVDVYTSVVRGVPELLIIYLLFFSSVQFVTEVARGFGFASLASGGFAFIVAVVSIGMISGAYSTEVVRGALAAIPKGHTEAAEAIGMSRGRILRRIVLPQMFRIALPGINNIWQTTTKDTALVSVTGLA